ncbi:MAG TPA: hypothetical protein VFE15_04915 [Marmoricola sp.]|jgi:hypothetical protein|nr:hypothetical protein [Marmoricola sp.]
MRRLAPAALLGAVLVLSVVTAGCGAQPKAAPTPTGQTLKQCHDQWRDVAQDVAGLDQDTDPSALATRWTSVIATIAYYRASTSAQGCPDDIATEVAAISALRQFSARLRPYDMAYQLTTITPSVDLYLQQPLPAPTREPKGKKVAPPTKAAVTAALATLTSKAAPANADLQPGWEQMASVELTDATAVDSAIQDLQFLAQDSPSWLACATALKTLALAVHDQDPTGTSSPSPRSSESPTTSPTGTPAS